MAAFTSTQNGDWDDGATWGNTSPGVKGTDWPGVAGDTALVGHDVKHTVSETNEMGLISVTSGGMFYPDPAANTLLTIGNDNIRVRAGGQLGGGIANKVGSAYVAKWKWNTTEDNTKGIYIENDGKLALYGDPAYYGSVAETMLANDAENTDGDSIVKTVQDMSALWNVGDELTIKIEDAGDSTSHTDAVVLAIIQSMAGTLITLDTNVTAATGVGSTWISPVVNVTRNVQLSKLNASTTVGNYNTLRPRIFDANASGKNNCVLNNVALTGFYAIDSDYDFSTTETVVRNGSYGFYLGANHAYDGYIYSVLYGLNCADSAVIGDVYSCSRAVNANRYGNTINGKIYSCSQVVGQNADVNIIGDVFGNLYVSFYGVGVNITGDVYSNSTVAANANRNIIIGDVSNNLSVFSTAFNCKVTGDVHGNTWVFSVAQNCTVTGNVYGNANVAYRVNDCVIEGKIGYDALDISKPNTGYDFTFHNGYANLILRGCKMPLAGLAFTSRGGKGEDGGVYSEDHGQVEGASYTYLAHGDLIKNTTTVRAGGALNSIEVVPRSSVNDIDFIRIFEWVEFDVASATQTRSIYIKGEGWATPPSSSELYFEAEYLDAASGISKTIIKSTAVLIDNTTWTQFTTTFTPSQAGKVRYRAYLKKYSSACKVYVDNQLN